MIKTVKFGFLLLCATALLAGCASTSNTSDTTGKPYLPPANEDITGGSATGRNTVTAVDGGSALDDLSALESVFYFDFDQSTLRADTRTALLAQAAYLKTNPQAIRLEGHADERGTREYNMALGERRALAIRDFLRLEGVNSPIEVVSYGEERPAVFGSNDASWQQNRRVELK
ncbi:MAG: peptidoglycan-associated lipoprotein Pal [Cellvibrionaceae bacterium]|nr:peptidoglycan-associated lipoprotein Pal [Cellvibrionaceae bacterium]